MTAVNYSTLRSDLKSYLDVVSDSYETVVVTRKGEGRNVVILSEEAFNNLMENLHVMADEANYSWLMESKKQLLEGKVRKVQDVLK